MGSFSPGALQRSSPGLYALQKRGKPNKSVACNSKQGQKANGRRLAVCLCHSFVARGYLFAEAIRSDSIVFAREIRQQRIERIAVPTQFSRFRNLPVAGPGHIAVDCERAGAASENTPTRRGCIRCLESCRSDCLDDFVWDHAGESIQVLALWSVECKKFAYRSKQPRSPIPGVAKTLFGGGSQPIRNRSHFL